LEEGRRRKTQKLMKEVGGRFRLGFADAGSRRKSAGSTWVPHSIRSEYAGKKGSRRNQKQAKRVLQVREVKNARFESRVGLGMCCYRSYRKLNSRAFVHCDERNSNHPCSRFDNRNGNVRCLDDWGLHCIAPNHAGTTKPMGWQ